MVDILDDNPKWLEAMRARLLTRELLEMPQTLARMEARMEDSNASTDKRFDQTDKRFDQTDKRFDQTDKRFDEVDRQFKSIRDDLGILKGAHARSVALEDAAIIARKIGLHRTKTLTREDLWDMTISADTSDILASDLASFRMADLVIEAAGSAGETCYVAVEISFTVNGRDTTRAIRNADYLTRFTGKRAYAAVSGVRRDNRIQDTIESGDVFWHQLPQQVLEAE